MAFRRTQDAPVHLDPIHRKIGLCAEFSYCLPVHRDSSCTNQLLSFAPACDTGSREDLLQAFLTHSFAAAQARLPPVSRAQAGLPLRSHSAPSARVLQIPSRSAVRRANLNRIESGTRGWFCT